MDAFGSTDPAALTVAIIALLYAMKETLSECDSNLEARIGDLALFTYQTACAPKGSRTLLKFLTEVGDDRHSRYRCYGVTINELKFAVHITKYCQIWKMAWCINIVLTAGIVIQIFPPPFRLFLWTKIMLSSFTNSWDFQNMGQSN